MHNKTIVHIDIDCFYAQVEELLDPSLKNKPLGIQQKTCLVTCNYKAREYGLKKLMYIPDAQKLCPELILVNGEDLAKYKKMSEDIFSVLQKFAPYVEKLGLDENYIDVSELVEARTGENVSGIEAETFTLGSDDSDDDDVCDCGCQKRLWIATSIAREIRQALFDTLGITSCAGIATNKLLAKLVGSQNKPNKQTVIFPHEVSNFLHKLGSVRALCGIGSKTAEILEGLGVKTVSDLQNVEISTLKRKFDDKMSEKLKELAFGIDKSDVKPTTKQKTISIEDSTYSNPLKTVVEVETKINILLMRLVDAAIIDQKRIPTALRLIIRKTTNIKELLQRESRQRDIPSSWFKSSDPVNIVSLLYPVAIKLFKGIMSNETQFTITLVGVAFTKFLDQDIQKDNNAILKFLKPVTTTTVKDDVTTETQAIKRKEECEDVRPSKKIKEELPLLEIPQKSSERVSLPNIDIPKDMDTKTFNRLPIPEKKRIMNELNNAIKLNLSTSIVDYPRKPKPERNKMDAFVFKY